MAFPFYSLEDVVLKVEEIYDDKFVSDQVDQADGVARQDLVGLALLFFFTLQTRFV